MTCIVIPFLAARRDNRWHGYRAESLAWLLARGVDQAKAEAAATDAADILFGIPRSGPAHALKVVMVTS